MLLLTESMNVVFFFHVEYGNKIAKALICTRNQTIKDFGNRSNMTQNCKQDLKLTKRRFLVSRGLVYDRVMVHNSRDKVTNEL